jgi:hypothetical protein
MVANRVSADTAVALRTLAIVVAVTVLLAALPLEARALRTALSVQSTRLAGACTPASPLLALGTARGLGDLALPAEALQLPTAFARRTARGAGGQALLAGAAGEADALVGLELTGRIGAAGSRADLGGTGTAERPAHRARAALCGAAGRSPVGNTAPALSSQRPADAVRHTQSRTVGRSRAGGRADAIATSPGRGTKCAGAALGGRAGGLTVPKARSALPLLGAANAARAAVDTRLLGLARHVTGERWAGAADAMARAIDAGAAFRIRAGRLSVRDAWPATVLKRPADTVRDTESRTLGLRRAGRRAGAGTTPSRGGTEDARATLRGSSGERTIRAAHVAISRAGQLLRTAPGFTVRDPGDLPGAHAVELVVVVPAAGPHADDKAGPSAQSRRTVADRVLPVLRAVIRRIRAFLLLPFLLFPFFAIAGFFLNVSIAAPASSARAVSVNPDTASTDSTLNKRLRVSVVPSNLESSSKRFASMPAAPSCPTLGVLEPSPAADGGVSIVNGLRSYCNSQQKRVHSNIETRNYAQKHNQRLAARAEITVAVPPGEVPEESVQVLRTGCGSAR